MPKDDAPPPSPDLTPDQIRALFDILTHYETYREITSFKSPDAVTSYGFPFKNSSTVPTTPMDTAPSTPRISTPKPSATSATSSTRGSSPSGAQQDQVATISSAPMLQLLLSKIILPLPGVDQFPREFWNVRVQTLLARLGDAELSESYDKGALGTRKVLATGSSAVVEMLGRGMLGGVDEHQGHADVQKKYDHGNADDLERAWNNVIQDLVYGDLADRLFDHFGESDDLEMLSPMVKASARHNIFHLATLMHQIFVLSPEGQYLLKLIENVHSLIPYRMMKQTLRIGNAATMMNGMMRILLAKLSVTSVTNWFGLTQSEDDGMNLLQRIISLVLSWDASEFKKTAEKVEKTKGGPTEEMLRVIKEHIEDSRSEHDTVRLASELNSQSIITSIFAAANPQLNAQMTEAQHAECLEYYSSLLSVRDRDCITSAFCRQPPDMFTQAIKDIVAAYEPIIRTVHANIDLREHFDALQGFIEEFIKTSKPKGSTGEQLPSVEDYVDLLMRHRGLLYKWIHAVASQCPDMWKAFRTWGKNMLCKFRKRTDVDNSMPVILNKLYGELDSSARTKVLSAVDGHASYLSTLNDLSRARMQYLVTASDASGESTGGPGVYLARWQALLDETPITPATARGPVRSGKHVKHTTTMGKTGVGGKKVEVDEGAQGHGVEAPDVSFVVEVLGDGFRREIQGAVGGL